MILLIDGMPKTGKTTLSRAFSEELGIPIIEFDGCWTKNQHFIVDEGYWPVYDFEMDRSLEKRCTWLFLLVDTPSSIYSRYHDMPRHHIGELQNKFMDLFDNSVIENKWTFHLGQFINVETGEKSKQFYEVVEKIKKEINDCSLG